MTTFNSLQLHIFCNREYLQNFSCYSSGIRFFFHFKLLLLKFQTMFFFFLLNGNLVNICCMLLIISIVLMFHISTPFLMMSRHVGIKTNNKDINRINLTENWYQHCRKVSIFMSFALQCVLHYNQNITLILFVVYSSLALNCVYLLDSLSCSFTSIFFLTNKLHY